MARSADILKAERVCGRRFVRRRRAYNRSIQAPHIRGLGKDIARAFESAEAKEQAQLRGGKRAKRKKGAFNVNVPSVPLPSWANLIPGVSNIKEYTAKNVQKCANDAERVDRALKKLNKIDEKNLKIQHETQDKFDEWVEGGQKGAPPKMPAFKKFPKSLFNRIDKAAQKESKNENLMWMSKNVDKVRKETEFLEDMIEGEEKRLRAGGKKKSRRGFISAMWWKMKSFLPDWMAAGHVVQVILKIMIAAFVIGAAMWWVFEWANDTKYTGSDVVKLGVPQWFVNCMFLFRGPVNMVATCASRVVGLNGIEETLEHSHFCSKNLANITQHQNESNTFWNKLGFGTGGGIISLGACGGVAALFGAVTLGVGFVTTMGLCAVGGGVGGKYLGEFKADAENRNNNMQAAIQDADIAETKLNLYSGLGIIALMYVGKPLLGFRDKDIEAYQASVEHIAKTTARVSAPFRALNYKMAQVRMAYNQSVAQTIGNAGQAAVTLAGTAALGIPITLKNKHGKKVSMSLGKRLAGYGITDPVGTMNTGINKAGLAFNKYQQFQKLPITMMYGDKFAANPQLQWMEAQKQKDMALFGDLRPTRTTYVLAVPGQPEVTYAQLDVAMAYATHPEAKIYEQKGNARKCVAGCQQKQAAGMPARRPMPANRAPPDALKRGSCPQGFAYNVHVGRCMPQDDIPTPPASPRHRAPLPIATGY